MSSTSAKANYVPVSDCVVQVDQCFTEKLGQTDQGTVFYSAIMTMVHALDMWVAAKEGERQEQLTLLRTFHCDELQGFLYATSSKPLMHKLAFAGTPAAGLLARLSAPTKNQVLGYLGNAGFIQRFRVQMGGEQAGTVPAIALPS
jgi:EAL domain-containing protein (putative c-di-GMP-specific phosphodiesterase class I)